MCAFVCYFTVKISEPVKVESYTTSSPPSPSAVSIDNDIAEDVLIQNRLRLAQKMSMGPKKKTDKYVGIHLLCE